MFVLLAVCAAAALFFLLRTKREPISGVQASHVEKLRTEISPLLPEPDDLSRYSIQMAAARHVLEQTEDTEEFMAALETISDGLPGFYSSLGSEEASLRTDEALNNLSKLF
jgi:hypothetical protein